MTKQKKERERRSYLLKSEIKLGTSPSALEKEKEWEDNEWGVYARS